MINIRKIRLTKQVLQALKHRRTSSQNIYDTHYKN